MQVIQCDRCGKIIESAATVKIKEFKEMMIEREYDLCRQCCEELQKFLRREENE